MARGIRRRVTTDASSTIKDNLGYLVFFTGFGGFWHALCKYHVGAKLSGQFRAVAVRLSTGVGVQLRHRQWSLLLARESGAPTEDRDALLFRY
jgi:hypothetical protein